MRAISGRRSNRRPEPSSGAVGIDIRPAMPDDAGAVLEIWFEGWWDGHGAVAPERLRRHRDREGLAARLDGVMPAMKVAESGGRVVGFVTVKDDELANLYISRSLRGSAAAQRLLAEGESMLARAGVEQAFLWCAVGNDRAFRFYLRQGWRDGGIVQCDVATPDGSARLPSHRMIKSLLPKTEGVS